MVLRDVALRTRGAFSGGLKAEIQGPTSTVFFVSFSLCVFVMLCLFPCDALPKTKNKTKPEIQLNSV